MSVSFLAGWAIVSANAEPAEEYRDEIRPTMQKYCYDCHGEKKQKGDMNFAKYQGYESVIKDSMVWQLVLERVQAFEMPPSDAKEMSFGERQDLLKFLRRLPRPELDCEKLASDRTLSFYRGYVMSRRLNRAEYKNTVRDLFGVEVQVEEILPADGGGGEGFDTAGNALFTSSIHVEKYMEAADKILRTVLPRGAEDLDSNMAGVLEGMEVVLPREGLSAEEAARKVIGRVATLAWRRPVDEEEIDRLMTMFERGWNRGDGYIASLRLGLKAVLMSPNFLFLVEPEPLFGGIHRLEPYPLASRLSYFLWSSMPDAELFALADTGMLHEPEIYKQQIRRMLKDPKARALGERFAVQWLDLQRLGSEVTPDPEQFPEFSELSDSMKGEAVAYFNHLFRNDRSLLELIDSDYTLVNQELARHYGLDASRASDGEFVRVTLETDRRGGVMGMAAVHALTSYPLRTSPVLRGKWVLESFLGEKVDPPPPGVPELEESEEEIHHLSLREQLERHRSDPECAACHDRMDPLGFSLENFDVLGRWREEDRGFAIDAAGTLNSGETFRGLEGLKEILMSRKEKVIGNIARKMTGYALGRELTKQDECVVEDAMKALKNHDYRASVLVETIALSKPFQYRFYPNQE